MNVTPILAKDPRVDNDAWFVGDFPDPEWDSGDVPIISSDVTIV